MHLYCYFSFTSSNSNIDWVLLWCSGLWSLVSGTGKSSLFKDSLLGFLMAFSLPSTEIEREAAEEHPVNMRKETIMTRKSSVKFLQVVSMVVSSEKVVPHLFTSTVYLLDAIRIFCSFWDVLYCPRQYWWSFLTARYGILASSGELFIPRLMPLTYLYCYITAKNSKAFSPKANIESK